VTNADALKRAAAERAVDYIEDGMILGLGTGSTARHVLQVIANRRERGELRNIRGVPTSRATFDLATELGIPLTTLDEQPRLHLAIDGADEVDPRLNLIKGMGGALLWEKIVESHARHLIIVVDESKLVDVLCRHVPVPVEVVQFAWTTHLHFMRDIGGKPELRKTAQGEPFITDSGNYIIDCAFERGLSDPEKIEREFRKRPGVVESGLFLGMVESVVVAAESGVRVMECDVA